MKYIVGASIGGLFGLGAPLMMNTDKFEFEDNNDSRQEDSQLVEDELPTPINNALTLPDNYCGYIEYKSISPKEQAKECLERSIIAVPAI
jgi:hypothetical protein